MRNPLLRFLILTAALLALYSYFLNQDRIFESYSKRDSSFAFKGLPSSKLENISFPVNTFSEERGCNGERRHSLPYVSGDTFRCIADVILDETTGINYLKAPYLNDIAAERPIVLFAKSDNIVELLNFRKIDETLSRPYILITHNSDFSFSRRIIRAAENSPNLRHWFGQNLESNSKLTTIPIGFENYRWGRMKPDIYSRLHGRNLVKSFLAVANFNPRNDERKNLLSILQKQSWVQIIDIGYSDANSNMSLHEKHESWLSSQQKFKYAFSPFGNGIDCHRTWEMLLIGVIPIVKSSILDDLFRPLEAKGAIIITKDWSDIDESFLLSHWETVGNDYIDRIWTLKVPEELYMDFWISKIHSKLNF